MANYKSEVTKLVARCRRIDWDVETPGTRRTDWSHRITCGDGERVLIHRTPRNPMNMIDMLYQQLNAHGFAEAEAAWKDGDERRRKRAIAEDRRKNEAKLAAAERQQQKRRAALAKAAGPFAPQPVHLEWLTTPHEWPDTKTVIMTPQAASVVLDTMNTNNRRPSPSRVTYFEQVMTSGEFGCTHQGIGIDHNGVLVDGQSRLRAIVNIDKDVQIQVTVGLDPRTFSQVDTGANRSGRDTAYIMGEQNPETIAAATKMLIHINDHGPEAHVRARGTRISNDKLGQMIVHYGDPLRVAAVRAKEMKKDLRRANVTALTCALYLIGQRLPQNDPRVEAFFADLHGGNLPRTDVVWRLRQQLLNGPASGRIYNAWEALAIIIKAWNIRHTGKQVSMLVWRAGNEAFPAHIFLPPPSVEQESAA